MNVLVSAHEAASRGDLAEVKRMVEEDVRHVRRGDCSNWSLTGGRHPLVNAAENGHIKVVRYLLEKGSPIDHQGGSKRRSALHWASLNGQAKMAAFLLEHGADPALLDLQRCTPLLLACQAGRVDVARCLVRHGGSAVNLLDANGCTPLIYAALDCNAAIVNLLLEAGAEPNQADRVRRTPLMIAAGVNDVETIKCLLRHPATDIDAGCLGGQTALLLAAAGPAREALTLLIKAGADPTVPDYTRSTAFDYVRRWGDPLCVALVEVRGYFSSADVFWSLRGLLV